MKTFSWALSNNYKPIHVHNVASVMVKTALTSNTTQEVNVYDGHAIHAQLKI